MSKIILASTSASRRDMLDAAGVDHDAVAPGVDENEIKRSMRAARAKPRALADALAEAKAVKISRRLPGVLVLGGDQILEMDGGETLDKAADMVDLARQLRSLRGNAHKLISAVVIAENGRAVWRHIDQAKLVMRDFSDAYLDDYLAREGDGLLACVGGYRIEGLGAQLFSAVNGSLFTVRGLPLLPLLDYLRTRGVIAA